MRMEQIDALMTQLGPVLDPLGISAFAGSKTWGVMLDEETSVLVDFDEAQGKLVLSCEVGLPPAGERGRLYELMLRHNFLWNETGGVRLAIDGADGNVVQIFDLPTDRLDVTRLNRAVQRFADAARGWREIIKRPGGASDKAGFEDFASHMIRV